MAPQREAALVLAYTARYNRLRVGAGLAVGAIWDRHAGLDDQAAAAFAEDAAQISLAAQTAAGHTVDGYLATIITFLTGEHATPVGIDPSTFTGAAVRPGVTPLDVYLRAVIAARVAVSDGKSFADAMSIGRGRATSTAETDVALAQRAAFTQAAGERVAGYRRVLTGKSCALCATASTQRYHRGELMPIHSHCDCGIAPIIGADDPGHVINRQLVTDLKHAARTTGNAEYWKTRHITVTDTGDVYLDPAAVHEHGELGPVLARAGHEFTGPGDIAA